MTLPDDIACIKHQCPDSAPSLQSLAFLTAEHILPVRTNEMDDQVIASVMSSLNSQGLKAVTWEMVRTATAVDSTMYSLVELIESGMPEAVMNCPNSCVNSFGMTSTQYKVLSYTRTTHT